MRRLAIPVVAFLLLLGLILEFGRPINHDVAWTLEAARASQAGAVLYRDILEINPPLIFWLSGLVNRGADVTGMAPAPVYRLGTLLLAMASALALWHFAPAEHRTGAAALLLLLAVLGIGWDFGQREHLIVLLAIPFVAMSADERRHTTAVVAGCAFAAAIAICFKPQYALVVALTAGLLLRGRRLAVALGMLILTGAAYLAAIKAFSPDYVGAVELLGPSYVRWATRPQSSLMGQPAVFVPALLLALEAMAPRNRSKWTVAWLAAATASASVVALQAKGFHYHYFPAIAFAVLAAHSMRGGPHGSAALLLASLTIVPLAEPIWSPGVRRWRASQREAITALGFERPGASIVAITPALPEVFPAVTLAGLRWQGTFPHVWWPFVEVTSPADRRRRDSLTTRLVHDVAVGVPDLIAIERPDLSAARRPGIPSMLQLVEREESLMETLDQHYLPPVTAGPFLLYRRRH